MQVHHSRRILLLAAAALAAASAARPARADFFDDVRRTFQKVIPRTFEQDIPRAFGAEPRKSEATPARGPARKPQPAQPRHTGRPRQ